MKVPLADIDKPAGASVRKSREALDFSRQLMSVRLYAQQRDIDRQGVRIRGGVPFLASWNVNILSGEPDHEGRPTGPLSTEIETDTRLDGFFLPGRTEMERQDEVGSLRQRPCHILRCRLRRLAGRPA